MQTDTRIETIHTTNFNAHAAGGGRRKQHARNLCRDVATDAGFHVLTATTTEEALEILDQHAIDIVITDLQVPQIGGLELLKKIRAEYPECAVIMLTQYGTIKTAIEATKLGAADYITKPFHVEELLTKLDRISHSIEIDQENRLLREQLKSRPGFGSFIGIFSENAARLQADPESGAAQLSGADPGRERHGQGTGGALDPFLRAAQEQAVRPGGLLLAGSHADRIRTVRLREGSVHRGAAFQAGIVRIRR